MRGWREGAIRKIAVDHDRSGDAHLVRLETPAFPGIDRHLMDASIHPWRSLKHRPTVLREVVGLVIAMLDAAIVALLSDPGMRYLLTYYDTYWLERRGLVIGPDLDRIESGFTRGEWVEV